MNSVTVTLQVVVNNITHSQSLWRWRGDVKILKEKKPDESERIIFNEFFFFINYINWWIFMKPNKHSIDAYDVWYIRKFRYLKVRCSNLDKCPGHMNRTGRDLPQDFSSLITAGRTPWIARNIAQTTRKFKVILL